MALSAEFKKHVHDLVNLLAKEFITRATAELMSYFEKELSKHTSQLNTQPLNLSFNNSPKEEDGQTPTDLTTAQVDLQQIISSSNNNSNNNVNNTDPPVSTEQQSTSTDDTEQKNCQHKASEAVPSVSTLENQLKQAEVQSAPVNQAEPASTLRPDNWNATGGALSEINIKSEMFDEIIMNEMLLVTPTVPSVETTTTNAEQVQNVPSCASISKNDSVSDVNANISVESAVEGKVASTKRKDRDSADDETITQLTKKFTTSTFASSSSSNTSSLLEVPQSSASITPAVVLSPLVISTTTVSPNNQTSSTEVDANEDKEDDAENDDNSDDEYDCFYDRWSSDNFPCIKVIKLKCPMQHCQKMCSTPLEYKDHLLSNHKLRLFNCFVSNCRASFENRIDWKKHVISVHKTKFKNNWKCKFCEHCFHKPVDQFRHYMFHHENGKFACILCEFTSNLRINIKSHLEKEHSKDYHKAVLKHHPTLGKQQFLSMKIISINCLNCSRKFESEAELHAHVRTTHQFETFPCFVENCKISFQHQKQLVNHMKICHKIDHCYFCKQTISSMYLNDLKHHTVFFHRKGQFQCTTCQHQPVLYTKADFRKHCELKHISETQTLDRRNQLKEKSFFCPIGKCTTISKSQKEMVKHLWCFHQISEFMCFHYKCNFSCFSLKRLDNHVSIAHKNMHFWKCSYCNIKGTSTHNELRKHVISEHFQGIFPCIHNNDIDERKQQFSNSINDETVNFNHISNQHPERQCLNQHKIAIPSLQQNSRQFFDNQYLNHHEVLPIPSQTPNQLPENQFSNHCSTDPRYQSFENQYPNASPVPPETSDQYLFNLQKRYLQQQHK